MAQYRETLRTREAVAMGLQRLGDANMPALIAEMTDWSRGNRLEQQASAPGPVHDQ